VNTNSRAVTLTWPVRHRFPLPRASQECAQAGRMSSDQSHNKAMNPPAAATRRPRVMANVMPIANMRCQTSAHGEARSDGCRPLVPQLLALTGNLSVTTM
jgi:hypothetical protein